MVRRPNLLKKWTCHMPQDSEENKFNLNNNNSNWPWHIEFFVVPHSRISWCVAANEWEKNTPRTHTFAGLRTCLHSCIVYPVTFTSTYTHTHTHMHKRSRNWSDQGQTSLWPLCGRGAKWSSPMAPKWANQQAATTHAHTHALAHSHIHMPSRVPMRMTL